MAAQRISALMSATYSVTEFVQSAKNYIGKMPDNRRKATVEYTLMDQVNDRSVHARELAILLKDLPCKINLIPFNPFPGSRLQASDQYST